MKNIIILILALAGMSFANTAFFLGMPNTRNIFGGGNISENTGLYLKHSVLINDPDMGINLKQQYVRLGAFYQWDFGLFCRGYYLVYGGLRYDRVYWDIGTKAFATVGKLHGLNLVLALQPFHDSEMGNFLGYMIRTRSPAIKNITSFVGFKNIPEYRVVERRLSAGLSVDVNNLMVDCEVSSPTSWKTQFTRVSVGFIYKFAI